MTHFDFHRRLLVAFGVSLSRILKFGTWTQRSELTKDCDSAFTERPACQAKLGHTHSAVQLQVEASQGRSLSHQGIISFVLSWWRCGTVVISFFFLIFKNVYFERERACVSKQGRGKERGRERIPNRLCAARAEPNVELELMKHEIMT